MHWIARKVVVCALVVTALNVGLPDAAYACSCRERIPNGRADYQQWLKNYDGAVFRGTVVAIERSQDGGELNVTFQVDRRWKGVVTPRVVLSTPADDGMCGIGFARGGTYLVAPQQRGAGLIAGTCSDGWFYVRDRQAFLAALGEGETVDAN